MKQSLLSTGRAAAALSAALDRAMASGGKPGALMFSGGFDSVFLLERARRIVPDIVAVTVAFEGHNRRTVQTAKRSARVLRARHMIISVTLKEYIRSLARVQKLLKGRCEDHDIPLMHAAFLKLPRSLKGFWAGMGSDQWLGEEVEPGGRTTARRVVRQHRLVAADAGRKIFFPFLEEQVLDTAEKIPARGKKDKRLLRSLAPEIDVLCPVKGAVEVQVPEAVRALVARCFKIKGRAGA